MNEQPIKKCPKCGSTSFSKAGLRHLRTGHYQQLKCGICAHVWNSEKIVKEIPCNITIGVKGEVKQNG